MIQGGKKATKEVIDQTADIAKHKIDESASLLDITEIPKYTYRGDSRDYNTIFEDGFSPWGDNTDLQLHAFNSKKYDSNYLSTSQSFDVAKDFNSNNIYVVRPVDGIDVNKVLGDKSPFPHELEIAIPGQIKNTDIRAVTLPEKKVSILNPNFNSVKSLDPRDIGFSQDTISYNKIDRKTGTKYTFDDIVSSMQTKGWNGDPINVVRMPDGVITSMDNSRVLAARKAKINVEAKVRNYNDNLTPSEQIRFKLKDSPIPKTWGDAIKLRIEDQKSTYLSTTFGNKFPNGRLYDPKVTGKK